MEYPIPPHEEPSEYDLYADEQSSEYALYADEEPTEYVLYADEEPSEYALSPHEQLSEYALYADGQPSGTHSENEPRFRPSPSYRRLQLPITFECWTTFFIKNVATFIKRTQEHKETAMNKLR